MKRRWSSVAVGILFVLGLCIPSRGNDEQHPGGRLFYPLWDVSTPNRLTFIIVTREALNEGTGIVSLPAGTILGGVPTFINRFQVLDNPGNCLPRGVNGSSANINRTDLGGTSDNPIFVDDLHFEYYGRSCSSANEVNHMSCADIDLFLLASSDDPSRAPRSAFTAVAGDRLGALDVHLITNGASSATARKEENSLMGHAVISDVAEGWAATYQAAAAKATACPICATAGGGAAVGYENYPMEVFLPFGLADNFPTRPPLRNVLSLWGPGLFPGASLGDTSVGVIFKWWDGRERAFPGSVTAHALIRPLGGAPIPGLDAPLDSGRFNVANFVCGHDPAGAKAENDGFPRSGTDATACGAPLSSGDAAHPSDNFDNTGDLNTSDHTIQSSTPIGWWRFRLAEGGNPPILGGAHSGRGLVGVVLSSTPGADAVGIGDAVRLWHKAACKLAQSNQTYGPPHLRDGGVWSNKADSLVPGDLVSLFNVFDLNDQGKICAGVFPGL